MPRRTLALLLAVSLLSSAVTLGLARLTFPTATAAGQDPAVVRAQRFELVDGDGVVRGVLSMDAFRGRPGLLILDEAGRPRAFLGNQATANSYGLGILDERGTLRAGLGAGGAGFVGINVRDGAGRIRANLFATDDGAAAAVQTWDEAGRVRAFMGACPGVPSGFHVFETFETEGPFDPCPGP